MGEGRGGFEMHADVVGGGDARGSNRDHVTRYLGSDDNKVTARIIGPIEGILYFCSMYLREPFYNIYIPPNCSSYYVKKNICIYPASRSLPTSSSSESGPGWTTFLLLLLTFTRCLSNSSL